MNEEDESVLPDLDKIGRKVRINSISKKGLQDGEEYSDKELYGVLQWFEIDAVKETLRLKFAGMDRTFLYDLKTTAVRVLVEESTSVLHFAS